MVNFTTTTTTVAVTSATTATFATGSTHASNAISTTTATTMTTISMKTTSSIIITTNTSTPISSPSDSTNSSLPIPTSSSGSTDASSRTAPSSDSSNILVIVAVVIVIVLLIAVIVTILIIIFIWRKNQKAYDVYSEPCKKPLAVTGHSNHKPEKILSVINPGYEKTQKTSDSPTVTETPIADMTFSDNPVFTESIDPIAIMNVKVDDIKDDNLRPCTSIYADPVPLVKSKGPPVVSMDNIEQVRELGTGLFGKVILANTVGLSYQYLGIGNSDDSTISIKVAVKILKSAATADIKKAFDKEIKFMSRLKDDNVIRLLGICTTGTPFIMMEYMENGDLNNYLQKFEFANKTDRLPAANEITLNALVYISYQIASGMKYLSSHKFIHRDLAARNILVGVNYTVKIADFGMSQNLYSAYYCRVGGRSVLPIRWMARECFFGKFSIKTDVWAFGITLWEIFTLCRCLPLNDLSNQQVVENAVKGAEKVIPHQPEICPDDIYYIMKSCLHHDPSYRADFSVLCDQLNEYYSNIL